MSVLNPLEIDQITYMNESKAFEDDNIILAQMMTFVIDSV